MPAVVLQVTTSAMGFQVIRHKILARPSLSSQFQIVLDFLRTNPTGAHKYNPVTWMLSA